MKLNIRIIDIHSFFYIGESLMFIDKKLIKIMNAAEITHEIKK